MLWTRYSSGIWNRNMQRAPNGLCMICKTNYLNMVGWFLLIHCLLNWKIM
jgi:Glu-decarb-GAD: glutamate decarboxylase